MPEGLADALTTTSEFQRNLLNDGQLTYQEYEASVLATVQCLRERGVTISVEPRPAPGKRIEFAYASTAEDDAAASAAYDECYREYENLVDIVWFRQNQPSEQTLDAARAALAKCLRAAGVALPDDPSPADFRAVAMSGDRAFSDCQARISQDFDLSSGFAG